MKIALFGKKNIAQNIVYLKQLFDVLDHEDNVYVTIQHDYFKQLKKHLNLPDNTETFYGYDDLDKTCDFMLSIGGDGTLLDTVTVIRDSGIPVLGINMGRLGFLSSVNKDFIIEAMHMLLAGKYRLDKRTMLSVKTPCDRFDQLNIALNEVTIRHYGNPCLISIRVYVDGNFMNTFWADGLIISTPTGSTGYSLSCGGPIIAPHSNTFVITPIATHNLTVRPVVIPDNGEIKLTVTARTGKYIVGLDARYENLDTSVDLILKKSSFAFNLILLENEDFFSTIRDKLNWGIDSRN